MWRRAAAFLIDLVPVGIIAIVQNTPGVPDHGLIGLISLVLLVAYFAGMEFQYGGTVGKRMMGLRVALPNTPDVGLQLMLRAIVKIVCIFPPMQTVYALIAIWRKDGRSLADFGTRSTVVDAFSLAPPHPPSLVERVVASALVVAAPIMGLLILLAVLMATVGEIRVE